jgi:hypothetical protein
MARDTRILCSSWDSQLLILQEGRERYKGAGGAVAHLGQSTSVTNLSSSPSLLAIPVITLRRMAVMPANIFLKCFCSRPMFLLLKIIFSKSSSHKVEPVCSMCIVHCVQCVHCVHCVHCTVCVMCAVCEVCVQCVQYVCCVYSM